MERGIMSTHYPWDCLITPGVTRNRQNCVLPSRRRPYPSHKLCNTQLYYRRGVPECQKAGLKSQGWAGTKSPGTRRGRIRSQPVRSINKVIVLAGRKSSSLPDPLLSFPGDILESSPTSTIPSCTYDNFGIGNHSRCTYSSGGCLGSIKYGSESGGKNCYDEAWRRERAT